MLLFVVDIKNLEIIYYLFINWFFLVYIFLFIRFMLVDYTKSAHR